MNKQPQEAILKSDVTLDVHSVFRTIQGEGPFTGMPAVFVRLAGCNLRCPGCDTIYTDGRQPWIISDLVTKVLALKKSRDIVVITGGEPLRQGAGLGAFIKGLTEVFIDYRSYTGCDIQIETNGTLPMPKLDPISGAFVSVVVSPKTPIVNPTLETLTIAYKYVLDHTDVMPDGLPGQVLGSDQKQVVFRPADLGESGIRIYVQPMDSGNPEHNEKNLKAAIQSCMDHGHTLCLQTHKIIGLE